MIENIFGANCICQSNQEETKITQQNPLAFTREEAKYSKKESLKERTLLNAVQLYCLQMMRLNSRTRKGRATQKSLTTSQQSISPRTNSEEFIQLCCQYEKTVQWVEPRHSTLYR